MEKNSTLNQNNSQVPTDTISYIHSTKNETNDFKEADYAVRYTIGPLNKGKAKFVGYEEGDLVHYLFEDEVGNSFSFSVIPKTYQLVVDNSTSEYGVAPNKKYLNKIFTLSWKHLEPKYNEEMEYPFEAIISIKLMEE